jgi:hypothetical protein
MMSVDPTSWAAGDLRSWLREHGVDHPSRAKKAELMDLVLTHMAEGTPKQDRTARRRRSRGSEKKSAQSTPTSSKKKKATRTSSKKRGKSSAKAAVSSSARSRSSSSSSSSTAPDSKPVALGRIQLSLLDWVEAVAWMVALCSFFLAYNAIGELAAMRGVDYTEYIKTDYDAYVPCVPFLVLPYILVYIVPFYYYAERIARGRFNLNIVRCGLATQMVMLFLGYLVFYFFPVQISPIQDYPRDNSWLHNLNWAFVHDGMTTFCAFPSMHVSNCYIAWYLARMHKEEDRPYGTNIVFLLAVMQFFTTVGTRAHYLLDLPVGFAFAWVLNKYMMQPLFRRYGQSEVPHKLPFGSGVRLLLCIVLPALAFYTKVRIEAATGWGGLDFYKILGLN